VKSFPTPHVADGKGGSSDGSKEKSSKEKISEKEKALSQSLD
jgi:hypothetical protein